MTIVATLLIVASAAYFWGANLADEDLWNHLTFGDLHIAAHTVPTVDRWSYSAPGHPFFDHEWFAEVVLAGLFRLAGAAGLVALKAAAFFVILASILDAVRTSAGTLRAGAAVHPATLAACLVLAMAGMAPGASFRPQLFTMTFLAVEWAILERADRRLFGPLATRGLPWSLALIPPMIVLWTNMHGGFLVGVGLHGFFVLGVVVRALDTRAYGRPTPPPRALVLVALSGLASLAATLANPYGLALHRYLAHTLGDHGRITEWMPIPLFSADHLRFKALVVATAATVIPWWWSRRRDSPAALLDWRVGFVVLAGVFGFQHRRHSVLFAIAAAPVFITAAEWVRVQALARWPVLRPRRAVSVPIAAGVVAISLVQLGVVVDRYRHEGLAIRYAREDFPLDAVEFLRANDLHGNMAVQFEWGGYALHHLGDRARVFIDGRYEATYPKEVRDDYFAFVEGAPGWERVLDAYPTDLVMVEATAPVVPLLAARPDLVRVFADGTALVYLKRTPTNAAAIERLTAVVTRAVPSGRDSVFP